MIHDLMTVMTVMTSLHAGVIAVTMSPHSIRHFATISKNNLTPKSAHEVTICIR